MTTALPVTASTVSCPATIHDLDAATLENLVVNGDCSKLNPQQRVAYYRARCDAAGLDYRTAPLQFVNLGGKLVLYALKGATDQIAAKNGIICEVLSQVTENGIRTVTVRSRTKDGRQTDEIGCVNVERLTGDNLANAYMKAVTKAKRRAVLSICGLGMLDESELETIPNAVVHTVNPVDAASQPPAVAQVAQPQRKSAKTAGAGASPVPPSEAAPHPAPASSPDPEPEKKPGRKKKSDPTEQARPEKPVHTPTTPAQAPPAGSTPTSNAPAEASPTSTKTTTPTPPSSEAQVREVVAGIIAIEPMTYKPQGEPEKHLWIATIAVTGEANPMRANIWSTTVLGIVQKAMEAGLPVEAVLHGKQGKEKMLWRVESAKPVEPDADAAEEGYAQDQMDQTGDK